MTIHVGDEEDRMAVGEDEGIADGLDVRDEEDRIAVGEDEGIADGLDVGDKEGIADGLNGCQG